MTQGSTPSHTHQFIHSRGVRMSVDVWGPPQPGPDTHLLLLIHGFGGSRHEWRAVAGLLADAHPEWRIAAVDLRGYGRSDKTPRGYDLITAASDMIGVIRGLGHDAATIVGHGYGGLVGWTIASIDAGMVRELIGVASYHPQVLLTAVQRRPWRHWVSAQRLLVAQVPILPERRLRAADGQLAERIFRHGCSPGFRDTLPYREHAARRRRTMASGKTAHLALESLRWLFRSRFRREGWEFAASLSQRVPVPVLSIDGSMDPAYRRGLVSASVRRGETVGREVLAGVGHYPHIEAPEETADLILRAACSPGSPPSPGRRPSGPAPASR